MRKRFLILTFLLLVIILSVITYNVYEMQDNAKLSIENQMVLQVRNMSDDFEKWISNKIIMLETTKDILNNLSMREIEYANIYNKYLMINLNDPDVSEVYVGLDTGEFLTGADWIPPEDYDPRKRIWYQKAKGENTTVISEPYIDRETYEVMVTISAPFYLSGEFKGVISSDIFISDLNNKILDMDLKYPYRGYIINNDGVIIASTDDEMIIGTNVKTVEKKYFDEFISKKNLDQSILKVYNFSDDLIVYRNLPKANWHLIIASPKDVLFKDLQELFLKNIVFNIVFLVIIGLILKYYYSLESLLVETNFSLKAKNKELNKANKVIEKINKKLEKTVKLDGLTKIYNRRYFDDIVETYWERAIKESKEIGLIMFDIDFFKKYNDFYGHINGDEVLVQIAKITDALVLEKDTFARYGGEEFTILRYDTSMEEMYSLAEQIREAIYLQEIPHAESKFDYVTISLGVNSCIPKESESIGYYIHLTDLALYQAKDYGRNKTFKASYDE